MSEIGRKHVEIPSEIMVILTQLVKEKGMQNVPTDVDMEKEII